MVTVVDPNGTPIPVYNKTGVAIVQVAGGSPGSPTPIPQVSGITVAVTTRSVGDHYQLPAGADIGDVVEVFRADANIQDIVAPSGETIRGTSSVTLTSTNGTGYFRKFSSTQWG